MKVDYKAIADAVLPGEDYETAYNRMSAETVTTDKDIQTADIKKYLILSDKWLGIKSSADPSAVVTMDALDIFESFRLTDADTGAAVKAKLESMMDALVTAGLITTTDKAAILAMGSEVKPKWPNLKAGHVQNSLEWRIGGLI